MTLISLASYGLGAAAAVFLLRVALDYRNRAAEMERLHQALREERAAALDLLNRIGLRVDSALDLDGSLEIIADYIVEATDAEAGAIFLLDPATRVLQARAVVGMFPPMHQTSDYVLTKRKYLAERIKRDRVEVGEGIVGFVAKTGESLLIADALSDPRVPKVSTDFLQMSSIIVAPLRIRQRILGVFAVVNKRGEDSFDERDLHLIQQLAEQAALVVDMVRMYAERAEQQRIEQELRVAHEFQRMLLPREAPRIDGLDVAAFSQPAREIGGDSYDFFWVDPTHLGVAIVDVSGKGIPGALVMAIVRSALRAEAQGDLSPKAVLRRVNARVLEDTQDNVFVTMTYGVIDVPTRRMRFVRAGHEPLITWNARDLHPRLLIPKGIALGLVDDETFSMIEECEISLKEGDTALLYTDGVIEAMDAASREYGSERLLSRLQEEQFRTADDQIRGILADINRFSAGIPQHDDITLLAIRVLKAQAQAGEEGLSEDASAPAALKREGASHGA
jgi:sigma-B regulation protein RsbU (phosphoserine phosphatase)